MPSGKVAGDEKRVMFRCIFFLLCQFFLFAADFDCVVVGSSPFSLFEALYLANTGHKVLIVEAAPQCGGAWQSITICGIPRVDLGCHEVGNNQVLRKFLEEYVGCQMVCMNQPTMLAKQCQCGNPGYYFSRGCFELTERLLGLIGRTDATIWNNTKVEKVVIDAAQRIAHVVLQDLTLTTKKVIVSPMSSLRLEPLAEQRSLPTSKYHHLYLLIQDPFPPRFAYQQNSGRGISRLMNLTHFVGIADTGQQLIAIQTHSEETLKNGQALLELMKELSLISSDAYILKEEPFIYETATFHSDWIQKAGGEGIIEMIQTGHFQLLANSVPKLQQVLQPYSR